MSQQRKQRKVSRIEVFETFQDSYRANDVLRVEGLQSLLTIRKKKAKLQERDVQRLTKKYGEDAERVRLLEKKQKANLDFIRGLVMESNRAKTKPEKVAENTWAVKGRVYDRQGVPVANAKVALYSVDERKVPKVAGTTTEASGRYKLTYQVKKKDVKEMPSDLELLRLLSGTQIEAAEKEDMDERLKININMRAKASVFVRACFGEKEPVCADSTPMVPRPGVCNYRDVILNIDQYVSSKPLQGKDIRSTRYLGNSATRELHDLNNEKTGCRIDKMRFDHMVNFKTIKMAEGAGYDFCAYCFGKEKSKR